MQSECWGSPQLETHLSDNRSPLHAAKHDFPGKRPAFFTPAINNLWPAPMEHVTVLGFCTSVAFESPLDVRIA